MKKIMSAALAATAALLLGACAAPSTPAPAAAPTEAAAEAAPATAPTVEPTTAPTTAPTAEAAATVAPTADTSSAPAAAGAPVNSPVAGTSWRLTFLGSQDEPEKAVRELQATVTFGPDGALNGSTGCADFTGTYTADEAALAMSGLTVAEGACENAEAQVQAERFAELLAKADGFSIEGVVLEVTAGDDALWFQPAS